jgi:hypothetical protein
VTVEYFTVEHFGLKDLQRFFSKVSINQEIAWNNTPCWTWTAHSYAGYGLFKWLNTNTLVHRLMYAWLVEPLPRQHGFPTTSEIDHLCRNRACCNPVHLELVTPSINKQRSTNPSAVNKQKTHCIKGHAFDEENTYYRIRNGKQVRDCKTCCREWQAAHIEERRMWSRQYKQRRKNK